jgi:hypothetical protein
MISFLIYIFFIKFRNQNRAGIFLKIRKFLNARFHIILVSLLVLLLALIPILIKSQNLQLHYKIVKGGDDIGWMRLEKNINGNKTNLLLVSELKTRFIFLIEVSAKETSMFENGQLLYSSLYRKTNGKVKLNKQTIRVSDKYVVNDNGEMQNL